MKNRSKNLNSLFANMVLFSAVLILAEGCAKSTDDLGNTAPIPYAAVNFIQASPDEPAIDIYSGAFKLNNSPFSYGQNSGYFSLASGIDTIKIYSSGTTTKLYSNAINFGQSANYSLFLANKPSSPEYVLLSDTLTQPTTGNALIRFINLSPDAPAVDLVVKGGATVVANKAYKGYSSFQSIAGNTIYTLEVHPAGSATVLATLATTKLQLGALYTVWFHGLVANTSSADQLAVDLIPNAYFSL